MEMEEPVLAAQAPGSSSDGGGGSPLEVLQVLALGLWLPSALLLWWERATRHAFLASHARQQQAKAKGLAAAPPPQVDD